jgi:16S rRNA G527 N7-methylase RsmG
LVEKSEVFRSFNYFKSLLKKKLTNLLSVSELIEVVTSTIWNSMSFVSKIESKSSSPQPTILNKIEWLKGKIGQ